MEGLISMQKKRVTLHNQKGRTGTGFAASHIDRTNTAAAEHIDEAASVRNQYWTRDGDNDFTRSEMRFYETHFRAALEARNTRYMASRHDERCQSMTDYYRNQKSCPDETLLYVGKTGNTVDGEKLWGLALQYRDWVEKTYPNYKPLSMALHVDEQGAPHIHLRAVFVTHDKDKHHVVGMEKALREMGIERPDPAKKEGRRNNRKMVFTAACRQKLQELAQAAGIEIETNPREKSKTGLSLATYQVRREEEKAAAAIASREVAEKQAEALQARIKAATEAGRVLDNETQRLNAILGGAKRRKSGLFGTGPEIVELGKEEYDELIRMAGATAKAEAMAKREAETRKETEEKAERNKAEAETRAMEAERQVAEAREALVQQQQEFSNYFETVAIWERAPEDVKAWVRGEAEARAEASDEINRLAARVGKLFGNVKASVEIMARALGYLGIPRDAQAAYIKECVRASEKHGAPHGGRAASGWHSIPRQTDYRVLLSELPRWIAEKVALLVVPPPGSQDETYGTPWEWLSELAKDEIKQKQLYRDNY